MGALIFSEVSWTICVVGFRQIIAPICSFLHRCEQKCLLLQLCTDTEDHPLRYQALEVKFTVLLIRVLIRTQFIGVACWAFVYITPGS